MAYMILPYNSLIESIYKDKNELFIILINIFFVFYLDLKLSSIFEFDSSTSNFNLIFNF